MHHSSDGAFAIWVGDWKLTPHQGAGNGNYAKIAPEPPVSKPDAAGRLHNLKTDAGERVNLYRRHPEIVVRLSGLLKRYHCEGRSSGRGRHDRPVGATAAGQRG